MGGVADILVNRRRLAEDGGGSFACGTHNEIVVRGLDRGVDDALTLHEEEEVALGDRGDRAVHLQRWCVERRFARALGVVDRDQSVGRRTGDRIELGELELPAARKRGGEEALRRRREGRGAGEK